MKKPSWFIRKLPSGGTFRDVGRILEHRRLHTVCEEACCPNRAECFSHGTATFLILGDICTRGCLFCAVKEGKPEPPDWSEPDRVAAAIREMELTHAVVTSVTRDDLSDGGASHFCATIRAIRETSPSCTIEVLIPDFQGNTASLETVLQARPDVLGHNIETVPRLYPVVRQDADYRRSVDVLRFSHDHGGQMKLKSGLMLGLSETETEIYAVFDNLIDAGCRFLTLGQYLRPSRHHTPVVRYLHPDEFEALRQQALARGFDAVAAGPFVRSSYRAEEMI